MINLPVGVLDNIYSPINEKSFQFSIKITCSGTLPNSRYFKQDLEDLKANLIKDLKSELSDFGSISIEEL